MDEGFRIRVNRIYDRWRKGLGKALSQAQEAGHVRADIDPVQTATFIVGAMAGIRSLAKNAQSAELMKECCQSLLSYWDSLRA